MLKPTNNFHFQFLAASRTFSTPKIVFAGFRRPRTSHREAQGVEIRMLQGVGSAPKKALKAPTGEPDMQELPKQTQTLLVEFERMVDKYIRVIERYSSTAATQLTNPEHRSIAVIAIRTTNDTRPPSTNKTTPHRRNGQSNPAPQSTTSNPPTPPKSPSAQNSAPPTWKPSPPPPPRLRHHPTSLAREPTSHLQRPARPLATGALRTDPSVRRKATATASRWARREFCTPIWKPIPHQPHVQVIGNGCVEAL